MSEAEEKRPLTRRERRIQEFGETGALPLLNEDGTSFLTNPQQPEEFFEIGPLDENGNPRSRREIRELREKQRLQRAAAQARDTHNGQAAAASVVGKPAESESQLDDADTDAITIVSQAIVPGSESVADADKDAIVAPEAVEVEVVSEEVAAEELAVAEDVEDVTASADPSISFDDLLRSDAEPAPARVFGDFPIQDTTQAEASEPVTPVQVDTVDSQTGAVAVEVVVTDSVVVSKAPVDGVQVSLEAEVQPEEVVDAPVAAEVSTVAPVETENLVEVADVEDVTVESVPVAIVDSQTNAVGLETIVMDAVDLEPPMVATPTAEVPVQAKRSSYTFPDITPLDDEVSVFDNPEMRTISGAPRTQPEFDDLISRAVAQEGASGSTNTSALILPAMPDAGDLSGPLGGTGELFITGSIDLPRSFSETGGHASLIDSVDADPNENFGAADQNPQDSGLAPVSATRAVSARVIPGPVVTEAQKEKSKLPVVMIATGGGLVVVVAGLLIWGSTSGMFG